MDHLRRALIAGALVWAVSPAWAGYASAVPPPGFGGSSASGWTYKAAANEAWTSAGTVRTNAALNVGGRSVLMPASMKLAANAPLFMARVAWGHPLLLAGTIAAPYVMDWAASKGFRIDDETDRWVKDMEAECNPTTGMCKEYQYWFGATTGDWNMSRAAAMQSLLNKLPATYSWSSCTGSITYSILNVVSGLFHRSKSGCTNSIGVFGGAEEVDLGASQQSRDVPGEAPAPRVVPLEEFEEELAPQPMPWQVPNEFPEQWPLPVELPKLNPDPVPWPQPVRLPVGAPIPVPDTDPQEYKQPYIDVRPVPTPTDPWRVDLTPGEQTGTDPNGLPEDVPSGPPVEETPQPDVCETNPNAAMCKPLGSGDDGPPIPTRVVPLVITPVSGFGPSTAECPAPRSVTLAGGFALAMPFDLLCQFADGVRPVIVGLAWLSAVLAFLGLSRKE